MPILTQAQFRTFAESGYLLISGLVTSPDLERAEAEVDRLIAEAPPPDGQAGHHFYWLRQARSPVLFEFLARRGGILDAAAELTGPVGIEVAFDQVQLALNIPPYRHCPGRPHIDGYRAGQAVPGTFTMLAGLLLSDQVTDNGGKSVGLARHPPRPRRLLRRAWRRGLCRRGRVPRRRAARACADPRPAR